LSAVRPPRSAARRAPCLAVALGFALAAGSAGHAPRASAADPAGLTSADRARFALDSVSAALDSANAAPDTANAAPPDTKSRIFPPNARCHFENTSFDAIQCCNLRNAGTGSCARMCLA